MPVIHLPADQLRADLMIWHLTETDEELKSLYHHPLDPEKAGIGNAAHPLRKRQQLATGLLLGALTKGKYLKPEKDSFGKPFLEDFHSISLSHSKQFVVVGHHHSPIGVDIEEPDERVFRIRHRFLNDAEISWLNHTSHPHPEALVWGVKEAVFKAIGGGGIRFKEDILVQEAEVAPDRLTGSGKAVFCKPKDPLTFKYYYLYLDHALLVYTIAE